MLDLDTILNRYRMIESATDVLTDGLRVNRLFGLNDLIRENLNSESVVCELGSHVGSSSALFAYYCKTIYCVDIWMHNVYELEFDKYILNNFDNIIKIKGMSSLVSSRFIDHIFDLVYVDAAHDYNSVKEDIEHWKDKVKKGGFLAGHDFHSDGQGLEVKRAVIESIGEPDKIYEDSSWIKKL